MNRIQVTDLDRREGRIRAQVELLQHDLIDLEGAISLTETKGLSYEEILELRLDEKNRIREGITQEILVEREKLVLIAKERALTECREAKDLLTMLLLDFKAKIVAQLESECKPKTIKSYETDLRMFIEFAGNVPIAMVRPETIQSYFNSRIKEVGAVTLGKYYRSLSAVFQRAVNWGDLEISPLEKVKKPKAMERKKKPFTVEEFEKLISVVEENDLKDLFWIATMTGFRISELLSLRWAEDINFTRREITAQTDTKSGKIRTVAMNKKAFEILKSRKENSTSLLVFHNNDEPLDRLKVTKRLKEYVIKAGLNRELCFHSLRRSFATWMSQKGVSIQRISKAMGHCNTVITGQYVDLSTDDLREGIELISPSN